jgi:hypothetical protein
MIFEKNDSWKSGKFSTFVHLYSKYRTLRLDKKYQSIVLSTALTRQNKLVTGSHP